MNLAPNTPGALSRLPLPAAIRLGAIAVVATLVTAFSVAAALPARAADEETSTAAAVVDETPAAAPSGQAEEAAAAAPPAPPVEDGSAEQPVDDASAEPLVEGAPSDVATPDATGDAQVDPAGAATKAAAPASGPVAFGADENQAPTAADDNYEMSQDTSLSVPQPGLLINDLDPDGNGMYADLFTAPTAGTLDSTSPWGEFTYTPPAGFTGVVSFEYSVTDDLGGVSTPATVTITVKPTGEPVSLPPVPQGDAYYYAMNTPLYIAGPGLLANDGLTDPVVSVTVDDIPMGAGTVDLQQDGTFVYTPEQDAGGSWWFDYRVCTAGGCSTAQVTLWQSTADNPPSGPIGPDGALPVAEDDAYEVVVGQTLEVVAPGLLGNDHDAEGDPFEIDEWTQPQGTLQVSPEGALLYTPPAGFVGTDGFQYRLRATEHGGLGEWATVEIAVVPVPNTPPVAVDDYFEVVYETATVLPMCLNDTDADGDEIGGGMIENITGGFLTGVNGQQCYVEFVPDPGFSGVAGFTYYAFDRWDASVRSILPATVTIVVGEEPGGPHNTLPEVGDDTVSTVRDTSVHVGEDVLLANDSDADGDALDPYVYDVIGQDKMIGEAWNTDASGFHYTPPTGFVGMRQFEVHVTDGTGTSVSTLTIVVLDPADPADPADPGDPEEPGEDEGGPAQPGAGLPTEDDDLAIPAAAGTVSDTGALAATGSEAGATLFAAALLTLAGAVAVTAARLRRRSSR